jgi:hypothetical protein
MSGPFAVPLAFLPPPERRRHGAAGEAHPGAKLTWTVVRAIRAAAAAGASNGQIRKRFDVNPGTVFKIVNNVQWREQ